MSCQIVPERAQLHAMPLVVAQMKKGPLFSKCKKAVCLEGWRQDNNGVASAYGVSHALPVTTRHVASG